MRDDSKARLVRYINEIIDATNSGIMEWERSSQSVYYYKTDIPKPAKIVVQQIMQKIKLLVAGRSILKDVLSYSFSVIDLNSGEMIVDTKESRDKEISDAISALYSAILNKFSDSSLDFLGEIIPKK